MASTRERLLQFIDANSAYALSEANLKVLGYAVASKQSGPGGSNWRQVYQFKPTESDPDPNGIVFSPTTEGAACLDADRTDRMWIKTDGKISNTGWVEVAST